MVLKLEGKRFGRLTVIGRAAEKDKSGRCWLWECLCDCGNTCLVPGNWLTHGKKRSCGCLQKENRENDVTGQRFGHLTAVRPTEKTGRKGMVWVWRCDCGNLVEATIDAVKSGGRRSCGCRNLAIKKRQAVEMQAGCGRQDGTALSLLKSNIVYTHNTSGYRGVSWHRTMQKWTARINFRGKTYNLGYYDSAEEASAAYQRAKKEMHEKYIMEQEIKNDDNSS